MISTYIMKHPILFKTITSKNIKLPVTVAHIVYLHMRYSEIHILNTIISFINIPSVVIFKCNSRYFKITFDHLISLIL